MICHFYLGGILELLNQVVVSHLLEQLSLFLLNIVLILVETFTTHHSFSAKDLFEITNVINLMNFALLFTSPENIQNLVK